MTDGPQSPESKENSSITQSEKPERVPVSNEQLINWIETGRDEHAVAFYGSSLQYLDRIRRFGVIPPQRERNTRFTYYFTPLYSTMLSVNPDLADKMRENLRERFSNVGTYTQEEIETNLLTDFSDNSLLDNGRIYARGNAVEHMFREIAGYRPPTPDPGRADYEAIWAFASVVDPDYLKRFAISTEATYRQELHDGIDFGVDSDFRDFIPATLDRLREEGIDEEFKQAILQSIDINNKGVLIYYDSSIITPDTHIAEYETEIATDTTKLLTASSISGIEILSDEQTTAYLRSISSA